MNVTNDSVFVKKISPAWLLIAVAAGYFIYTLGFMTNFYDFFYAGTAETFEFYKELQVVNHYIFRNSLVLILVAIFCLITGCDHKQRNWLSLAVLGGVMIYLVSSLLVLFQTIPYFEEWYQALDLSSLKTHHSSLLIFKMVYIFPILALVLMLIVAWKNYRKAPLKEVAL